MKFVPDFLKKKSQPDPTKPETMEKAPPVAEESTEKQSVAKKGLRERFFGASKKKAETPASVDAPAKDVAAEDTPKADSPGMLGGLRKRIFGDRKKPEEQAAEAIAEAPKSEEGVSNLEKVRNSLAGLVSRKKSGHKVNTFLIVAGAGVAVAGMAADMMFLGGAGTLAVLSMVYSDFRNAQHIKKITDEIGKIDDKIGEMKKTHQPVPDFSPALHAVRSSIEDFQASAQKVPPEVANDLEQLRKKVEALQEKIAPANDDSEKPATEKPKDKPAAPGM